MKIIQAVVESSRNERRGREGPARRNHLVRPRTASNERAMALKLGACTACLHEIRR
ncbi:hypothetical protein [Streptomyces sp. NPDC054786]